MKKYLILFLLLLAMLMIAQSIHDPLYVYKEAKYLGLPYDFRGLIKIFLYLGGYASAAFALTVILGIRSTLLFSIFLALFFLFYGMDFFMQLLGTSYGFSYNELIVAMNETGNYKNLLSYINYVGYAILLATVFVAILIFLRRKFYIKKLNSLFLLAMPITLLATYAPVAFTHSIKYETFPAFTKISVLYIRALIFPPKIKERILVKSVQPTAQPKFKNIIWIIDESITGSYLSINGYNKSTTPYLGSLSKNTSKVVNFGMVNSVGNCSATSNKFLRIGLNPNTDINYKKDVDDLPTIFQYAERAGYTTWLFDSQAGKDVMQNYLTIYDKRHIDHFETLENDTHPPIRDKIFLDKIETILKNDKEKRNFIVIVKFGAHWPYLLSYEQKKSTFLPILDSTIGGMTLENKEKQINTYLNAIKHSTDEYLKDFVSKIDLNDTIAFYTSDHGQNILESKGKYTTHCNRENIVKNEVTVPLLVLQNNAKNLFHFNKNLFYSQIQIFPTTLELMGFDDNLVGRYGKTLSEGFTVSPNRKYLTPEGKINTYK